MTNTDPKRPSFRLGDQTVTLRLEPALVAAIEKGRDGRSTSDTIRDVLERAFTAKGDALFGRIGEIAARDRRELADVIRITLQDAFQKGQHGKPIYPTKKPRVK